MRVEKVGFPFAHQRLDPLRQGTDFAPFADRRARRRYRRGAIESQPVDRLAVRSRLGEVSARIAAREEEIGALLAADRPTVVEVPDVPGPAEATDDTELSEEAAQ